MIPITNLKAIYQDNQLTIDVAVKKVLESGWYVLGQQVKAFESAFAEWVGVPCAVGVANGTDALELALRVCGVGAGDYVATVSHTAVATISAIERTGARPLFIDIDPKTFTLCPNKLENGLKKFTKPVKAIIPVHLYGHMADMPAIVQIAHQYSAYVIEDCAQAVGASWQGIHAGGFGDLGAFSFYPTKNLGAFGDGGAIITRHKELAEKLRELRQYGWRERNNSLYSGVNSRLDEIQAAILLILLKRTKDYNLQRSKIAKEYDKLSHPKIKCPMVKSQAIHAYHQYVISCSERDNLKQFLEQRGIEIAIHYPKPVHLQDGYQNKYDISDELEVTERCVKEILSLPVHPFISESESQHIFNALLSYT